MVKRVSISSPLLVLAFMGTASTQEASTENQQPVKVMRPDLAVAEARQDVLALQEQGGLFPLRMRYVMVNQPTEYSQPIASFACNHTLLHSAKPWPPQPLRSQAVYRIDLLEYAGYDRQIFSTLVDAWDRMQDEQFYLPTDEWRTLPHSKARVRVVVPAEHCNQGGQLVELIQVTQSAAPIVSMGQFLRFLMNSDFGGLYPEFRGFNLNPRQGTAEAAFLARADVRLEALSKRNADMRVFLTRTPTAGVGFIEAIPAAGAQLEVGPTAAFITRDYFYGDVDAVEHPFENILGQRHDATEIFLPNAAGCFEYALFNGQGGFVRSAPLNPPNTVAADRTVPAPHPPILQGPSSCIRCHIMDNPNTKLYGILQTAPNYINVWRNTVVGQDEQGNPVKWDVFLNQGKAGDDLKRLVEVAGGEVNQAFPIYGRTYAKFVYNATGLPLEDAVKQTMGVHDDWLYAYVTPRKAMLTLGYSCETDEQARQLFNYLVPIAFGEPNRLMLIRSWGQVNYQQVAVEQKMTIDDWLDVYPEVALKLLVREQQLGNPYGVPVQNHQNQ